MFNRVSARPRKGSDEPERPFWISFADLMTAMMVLFLVAMGVALLAVTKTVDEDAKRTESRNQDIAAVLDLFEISASKYEGVVVDRNRLTVNFGSKAQFGFGRSTLGFAQQRLLREFTPEILDVANTPVGVRILKRIVVEGYTDRTGSYLANLDLSLRRAQRVLCVLFARRGQAVLNDHQKREVRKLFFVGGYSFNNAKDSDEESRRVEMRIELLGQGAQRSRGSLTDDNYGDCAI